MAKTAVEWLVSKTELNYYSDSDTLLAIKQAKQMEREQRINAQMDIFNHINTMDYGLDYLNKSDAALKYAEDYYTRLQNETN